MTAGHIQLRVAGLRVVLTGDVSYNPDTYNSGILIRGQSGPPAAMCARIRKLPGQRAIIDQRERS